MLSFSQLHVVCSQIEHASAVFNLCDLLASWPVNQFVADCEECVPCDCANVSSFPSLAGALLTAEHVKGTVSVSVEEGKDNKLRVSE